MTLDPALVREIDEGLRSRPKRLPFALFYDDVGSALFEAITKLPEYGLTRADDRLLSAHAADVVLAMGSAIEVAELGPGSGRKASMILSAAAREQGRVRFFAVDVSRSALACCARLATGADVVPVLAQYLPGLDVVLRRRDRQRPLLLLFLGSNIGNLERAEAAAFLRDVRERLLPGDALLLSTDLVKAPEILERAYDDPLGVTAAFDLNALARLNRELGGHFDLSQFSHRAKWNAAERRVEMHLQSLAPQAVRIDGIGLDLLLDGGELIWTESSCKYSRDEVAALADAAGFDMRAQWLDVEWPFALTLMRARGRA